MHPGKVVAALEPPARNRELEELRRLLARAERGDTADDRFAVRLFRALINRRCQR